MPGQRHQRDAGRDADSPGHAGQAADQETINRRHRVTASNRPMNAPKQTTLTASHGAREFSLMTVGLGGSRKILL